MNLERIFTRALLISFIVVVFAEALWIAVKRAHVIREVRNQFAKWREYWDLT